MPGLRPVYPWCIDEFNDPHGCGSEAKYYHPAQETLPFSQEQTSEPTDRSVTRHYAR